MVQRHHRYLYFIAVKGELGQKFTDIIAFMIWLNNLFTKSLLRSFPRMYVISKFIWIYWQQSRFIRGTAMIWRSPISLSARMILLWNGQIFRVQMLDKTRCSDCADGLCRYNTSFKHARGSLDILFCYAILLISTRVISMALGQVCGYHCDCDASLEIRENYYHESTKNRDTTKQIKARQNRVRIWRDKIACLCVPEIALFGLCSSLLCLSSNRLFQYPRSPVC